MAVTNIRPLDSVNAGVARTADTLIQALTPNQNLRFGMTSPADSGQIAHVSSFGCWTPIPGGTTLNVYTNATATVTANAIAPMNQNMAPTNVSVVQTARDTGLTDPSGRFYRALPVPGGVWQEFDKALLALSPGQSLGFSARALIAGSVIGHLSFIEQGTT